MNMIESFKTVFQKYATFTGRATRPEYWWFALASFLISLLLNLIGGAAGFIYLSLIWSLVALIPSIAVGVRRMHDVNKSGWYLLIPIYNLVLACTEGTPGTNEYGPNPDNPAQDFDFDQNKLS